MPWCWMNSLKKRLKAAFSSDMFVQKPINEKRLTFTFQKMSTLSKNAIFFFFKTTSFVESDRSVTDSFTHPLNTKRTWWHTCSVQLWVLGLRGSGRCVYCGDGPPSSSSSLLPLLLLPPSAHSSSASLPLLPALAFPAAWLKLIPLSVRRPDADVAC